MTGEKLESEFHKAMLGIYRSALSECTYRASRFVQMVNELGRLHAAKALLRAGGFPEGLITLWEYGALDLSMEALVLQEPWSGLFDEDELGVARKRLRV